MPQRRSIRAAATACALALALAACGSDTKTSSTASGSGKAVNIAFVTYGVTDYSQAEIEGMNQALGGKGSVTPFNANFDPGALLTSCQDAITSGKYNAIIIATVDPASGIPCVEAAAKAKIPVGTVEQAVGPETYNLRPQLPGVVSVATLLLVDQVKYSLDLVKKACGDTKPCKVIAEIANPADPFTNDLVKGVAAGDKNISIVATYSSNYDPGEVTKVVPDVILANKDANVLMAAADSTGLAALPALEAAGVAGKVKLVGNGGSRAGAKAIAAGQMFGTTANWPKQHAALVTTSLIDVVNGRAASHPSVDVLTTSKPTVVTKDNVASFTPEWGAE